VKARKVNSNLKAEAKEKENPMKNTKSKVIKKFKKENRIDKSLKVDKLNKMNKLVQNKSDIKEEEYANKILRIFRKENEIDLI
jgi:hypothetical protein